MPRKNTLPRLIALLLAGVAVGSGCATARRTTPELSSMRGKKVALVEVDGEETARKIVEVALVNQLVQRGTFILVSKQDVEAAREVPNQDPRDWAGIARRAGADYALRAKVLQFDGDTRKGYSEETVYDTQLADEQGTDGKTERVFKAESLTGHVRVELQFTHLSDNDTRTAVAEAQDQVTADARSSAIHLPPKLGFLEKLSNKAFRDFFDRYN